MTKIYKLPFPELEVSHAEDTSGVTRTMVCIFDEPAVAAVHIMGAWPSTRETELLNPKYAASKVDAIVFGDRYCFGGRWR